MKVILYKMFQSAKALSDSLVIILADIAVIVFCDKMIYTRAIAGWVAMVKEWLLWKRSPEHNVNSLNGYKRWRLML